MRRNHEFLCPSALSPGFRNWVEMTRNMQQEGVGLVLLPRPASLVLSPVLPCLEAPLGESDVPLAYAGGERPTHAAVLLADAGAKDPRVPPELMCWEGVEGVKGVEWRLVLSPLILYPMTLV